MDTEIFFAKLRPLTEVMRTKEYMDYVFLDYESSGDLARQQVQFMKLFRDRGNEWIRFKRETNGYIYVDDIDEVVILHRNWLMNKMKVENDNI